MARRDTREPIVVWVSVRSRGERARCVAHLHDGGFIVFGRDQPPARGDYVTVAAAVELTPVLPDAAGALMQWDHYSEIAQAIGTSVYAARDRGRRLAQLLGVRSRRRVVVRLLEYGLLRYPGMRVAPLVLRVGGTRGAARGRVARHLRDGGYMVMDDDRLPFAIRLGAQGREVNLTPGQRQVIPVFLAHDKVDPMRRALKIRPSTCRDHLQNLEELLGVHTWHRLVVRLVECGWLLVEPSS